MGSQRSVASVTIAFGLISVPVKLYTATDSSSGVKFNLIHKGCGSRLKQQYNCIKEDIAVSRDDTVKGYEFAKDQYVIFTPEELKTLEEEGTHTVEICEFVPAETVDPLYYDKAYFIAPDKGGNKPYALLVEVMRQTQKTAIGRYAVRGKQYIVQLRAIDGGLVMQQLLYGNEVRSITDLGIDAAPVLDKELALAKQLIEQISSPKFDPEGYEDGVNKRIHAAIEAKVAGKEITISSATAAPTAQVIDLMAALVASVAATKKEEPVKKAAKKKAKVA